MHVNGLGTSLGGTKYWTISGGTERDRTRTILGGTEHRTISGVTEHKDYIRWTEHRTISGGTEHKSIVF